MNTHDRPTSPRRTAARAVAGALPTLLVLTGVAALGYWGHRTGWKAPRISELLGARTETAPEDWCETHDVPDSRCIACHPELAGENAADWCKEHGVPESQCTVCHPEILATGVAGDWCAEHGLPESGCTICHPEIARKGEPPADEDAVVVGADPAAELVRAEADSTSSRARDARTCQTHALKVQFASAASMRKSGIRLGRVVERPMSDSVVAGAEADFDRTRHAKLAARVSGIAWRVEREIGQAVRAGDVLALVESAEVGRSKVELLRAQATLESARRDATRIQASSEAGFRTEGERIAAQASVRDAEIQLFDARQKLATLGLPVPDDIVDESTLARLGLPEALVTSAAIGAAESASLVPLTAPFDGVVVARDVVPGEVVDPSRTLFEIADPSRMWITIDVPQADAQRLLVGSEVSFRPEDSIDDAILGRVTWIATSVDETTRTVKVRADVPNADRRLRAHAFGQARIVVRTSPNAIAVPNESVQWEGCCHVVFVRLADEIFQTRKVRLGAKDAAWTEILGGVLPGEVLVTAGSHVLKSEILKSALGAGCCAE